MKYFLSVSGSLRQLNAIEWNEVLVTPLFASKSLVNAVTKREAFFDSGGFQVLKGKISFNDLYQPLMDLYCRNQVASVYTLPDWPIGHRDSEKDAAMKATATVEASLRFYMALPLKLQEKALGVIQARHISQVESAVEKYLSAGIQMMGYGGVNGTLTKRAISHISHISNICNREGVKLHIFGVGSPANIKILIDLGVHSCDSSSVMSSAGYMQVFINTTKSSIQLGNRRHGVSEATFLRLKEAASHSCLYCDNFKELQKSRLNRVLHNWTVVQEIIKGQFQASPQLAFL